MLNFCAVFILMRVHHSKCSCETQLFFTLCKLFYMWPSQWDLLSWIILKYASQPFSVAFLTEIKLVSLSEMHRTFLMVIILFSSSDVIISAVTISLWHWKIFQLAIIRVVFILSHVSLILSCYKSEFPLSNDKWIIWVITR